MTEAKCHDRMSDKVLVQDEYLVRVVKTNGSYINHHIDVNNKVSTDTSNDNDKDAIVITEVSQNNIDLSILVDSNKRKFVDISTIDVNQNNKSINTIITTYNNDIDDDTGANNHINKSKIDHNRDAEVSKKMPMKKRHQTSRPLKQDRLCSYALQGTHCPHDKCNYNHNLSQFLLSKPPDIGDRCYLFDTYGFCSYGITCRFGDSHINRETCMNIIRSDYQNTTTSGSTSDGSSGCGGSRQQQINVLSKEVQLHLRKKRYDFWMTKKKNHDIAEATDHNNDGDGNHNNDGDGNHNNDGDVDHNNDGDGNHNNDGDGNHNNDGDVDHNNDGDVDHNNDGDVDHNNAGDHVVDGYHNNDGDVDASATTAIPSAIIDDSVVIDPTIDSNQINNDAINNDGDNRDGYVTSGDSIVNKYDNNEEQLLNGEQNIIIATADPLTSISTLSTITTTSDSIMTTTILSETSMPTATSPLLLHSSILLPLPNQRSHHTLGIQSSIGKQNLLSVLSTSFKLPVAPREVSLKPYPTKSMKLLDFSNKVYTIYSTHPSIVLSIYAIYPTMLCIHPSILWIHLYYSSFSLLLSTCSLLYL